MSGRYISNGESIPEKEEIQETTSETPITEAPAVPETPVTED